MIGKKKRYIPQVPTRESSIPQVPIQKVEVSTDLKRGRGFIFEVPTPGVGVGGGGGHYRSSNRGRGASTRFNDGGGMHRIRTVIWIGFSFLAVSEKKNL